MPLGRITPGSGGFWEQGGFNRFPNTLNPWRYGSKMAPFDQKVSFKTLFTKTCIFSIDQVIIEKAFKGN
jgi:hypothetical protein